MNRHRRLDVDVRRSTPRSASAASKRWRITGVAYLAEQPLPLGNVMGPGNRLFTLVWCRCLVIVALLAWSIFFSGGSASAQPSSQNPSNPRLIVVPGLQEPLVRTHVTNEEENASLQTAVDEFRRKSQSRTTPDDEITPLADFAAHHPDSGWAVSVETNVGLAYYTRGYFSRALKAFESASELGRTVADSGAKPLVDRAIGELALMHARLGHKEELERLFRNLGDRPFSGPATETITGAHEGLWEMRNEPGNAFLCGPKALANVLRALGAPEKSVARTEAARSGPNGLTLQEVSQLATEAGLAHQLVYRTQGQPIPVPSVIHWKLQHYAAVVAVRNGRYHVKDPTFGGDLVITREALEAESSGYFLVPSGAKPGSGWRTVTEREAHTIHGMGFTGQNQPGAVSPDDTKIRNSCNHGMCIPSAHAMNVSLNLSDTPVGYAPSRGPSVFSQLTYNQREAGTTQMPPPAMPTYFNVGPKWAINWLSYIQDDPNNPGTSVYQYVSGGGTESYTNYVAATGQFARAKQGDARLSRTPTTGTATAYTLTEPDGSKQVFTHSDGAATNPRRMFLTSIVDAQGNALTLAYDTTHRLTTITDAMNRVTTFGYGNANPLLVTAITDPFGRSAGIHYDAIGRLDSITDVILIVSSFTYDPMTGQLDTMTTPYCKPPYVATVRPWQFKSGEDTNANSRWLEITDPLGLTERLEFIHGAGMPVTEPTNTVPTGMNVHNDYLQYRNSFYWDKYTYPLYGTGAGKDYTKATRWHWLHNGSNQTSPLLESTKNPLESRVWYNYEGQTDTIYEGSSGSITAAGRRLEAGTNQLYKYTYNSSGNVTTETDPIGRETKYTYEANDIDLSLVQRKESSSYYTIAGFSLYDAKHRPQKRVDEAGKTWSYTYTATGQVWTIVDPLSHVRTYAPDALGRLHTIVNENNVVERTYNYPTSCVGVNCDLPESITDSENRTLVYERDALDRITKISYPDGTTERNFYTNLDRTAFTDRLQRTSTYTYDADRRLIAVADPLANPVQYTYYRNGALETVTDKNGHVTHWDIDIQGRPTLKTFHDGTTVAYGYESSNPYNPAVPTSGRLQTITDALGQTKTYGYTADDLLLSTRYTNTVSPTTDISFQYNPYYPVPDFMWDGTGVPSGTTTCWQGVTHWFYGRPGSPGGLKLTMELHDDQESEPGTTCAVVGDPDTQFYYDDLNRLQERRVYSDDAMLSEMWLYDALGRVEHHYTPVGVFDYTYNGQTRAPKTRTLAFLNIGATWSYDTSQNDLRPTGIVNTHGGPALTFGYDRFAPQSGTNVYGQVTSRLKSTGGSSTLSCNAYDDLGRLQTVRTSAAPATCSTSLPVAYDYTYDAAGNTTKFTNANGTASPTFNTVNQSSLLTYDLAGHVTSDGTRTFKWDAEDRLIEVSAGGTTLAKYRYDGLSRLFEATHPGKPVERFSWCGMKLCTRYVNALFPAKDRVRSFYFDEGEYFPSGKRPIAFSGAEGDLLYIPRDRKLVATADALGPLGRAGGFVDVDRAKYEGDVEYTPYGEIKTGSVVSDHPFSGLYHDKLVGLYLSRTRVYDPSRGRWLSRDPAGEVASPNLYAYAGGDPMSQADPSGLFSGPAPVPVTAGSGVAAAGRAGAAAVGAAGAVVAAGLAGYAVGSWAAEKLGDAALQDSMDFWFGPANPDLLPPSGPANDNASSSPSPRPDLPGSPSGGCGSGGGGGAGGGDGCRDAFEKCVSAGGEFLPGRVHGESRCGSCLHQCSADGAWPSAIYNWRGTKLRCPG